MMNKSSLLWCAVRRTACLLYLCGAFHLTVVADDVVRMTTDLPVGEQFTFSTSAGAFTVDWGDGVEVSLASTGEPVKGTLAGQTVKLSGAGIDCLICRGQQLTSLDISAKSKLAVLDCSDNNLTGLNLLNQSSLTMLDCSNNQLSALRLPTGKTLEVLIASGNILKTVSLSSGLKTIWVDGNQFSKLTLGAMTQIESVVCDENEVSTITLPAAMPNLTDFWVAGNQLSQLKMTDSPLLETMNVENNGMWEFEMGSLGAGRVLRQAFLGGNHFTLANLLPTSMAEKLYPGEQLEWPTERDTYEVGDTIVFPDMSVNVHTNARMSPVYKLVSEEGTVLTKNRDYTYGATRLETNIMKFLKAQPSTIHLEVTSSATPGVVIKSVPFRVVDEITGIGHISSQSDGQHSMTIGNDGAGIVITTQDSMPVTVVDDAGRICWKGTVEGRQRIPLHHGVYIINGKKIVL